MADALLAGYLGLAGVIYIWAPSINPFQIWAMRRFVPLILPGIILLAGVGVDPLLTVLSRRRSRPLAVLLAVGAAAALLLPTAAATAPVRQVREHAGYVRVFEAVCHQAGPDAVLVVTGTYSGLMPQAFRSWCGNPTVLLAPAETPQQLQQLAQAWADQCRTLLLVASPPSSLAKYQSVLGPPVATPVAANRFRLVPALLHRADAYQLEQISFLIAPVKATRSCPAT